MMDSYTWVSLGQVSTHSDSLAAARMAVMASTGPARVLLLVGTEAPSGASDGIHMPREHCLATFPPHSVLIRMERLLPIINKGYNTRPNKQALSLILIENKQAAPFRPEAFKTDLIRVIPNCSLHPPPWKQGPVPKDTCGPGKPLAARRPALLTPSLMWYRPDSPMYKRPDPEEKKGEKQANLTMRGDFIPRTLGMLGHMPTGFIFDLLSQSRDQRTIHPTKPDEVQKIILNKSKEAFLRAELWRKRHK